ncbi:hypothetical protein, partial [Acinetobacter baumannii]|uniref:hypothetical protein n=1 Tax=Acinetobacter baumannii TaxID=470 RepID=UPI001D17441C
RERHRPADLPRRAAQFRHHLPQPGRTLSLGAGDGYEVDGDNVAVYGEAESAITHAVFLRTFTDRVTVVVHGDQAACEQAIALAEHYAIRVIGDRVESMQPCENGIDLLTCRGERHNFDIIYPSLGARFRSELA